MHKTWSRGATVSKNRHSPKFPTHPWPLAVLSWTATLRPLSFLDHTTKCPESEKLGVTAGASEMPFWWPHPRRHGIAPCNCSVLQEGKGRDRGRAVEKQAHLPQHILSSPTSTGGRLPNFPLAPLVASGTQNSARPRPGPLTVSADTQAIKPKVSRIHAFCIFPRGRGSQPG